jgi:hypothetical protein
MVSRSRLNGVAFVCHSLCCVSLQTVNSMGVFFRFRLQVCVRVRVHACVRLRQQALCV